MAGHPPTLIPLLLPWSSCHQPFSSPAFKTFPSSSLGQICSLHHAFALWHWHSHGRKMKSPSSLLAFAFQSFQVKQAPPRETHAVYVCACTCAYVCNSFSSPRSQSLREKINYPDSVKSTWAIPLDTALNPAPENRWLTLSNRDTYVVLATGCLMGTHVILSSRFFLLFTGREDAHMSNWHFYFSSFKHLLACSNQVGEAGPGSPTLQLQQDNKKVTEVMTICPKFQAIARSTSGSRCPC